jgi:hypothetical protein
MRDVGIVIGLSGFLLTSTHMLGSESDRKLSEPPAIDVLQAENLQSLPYMCECEFFRGPMNGTTTVFATRKERTVAFAMVDGRLLSFQRDGKPAKSICRKHTRHYERWVAGYTAIFLDYRAIGSGEESCWFEGKMTVTVGRREASTSISGACGC